MAYKLFPFFLLLLVAVPTMVYPQTESYPLTIGETHKLHSLILNEDRFLNISIPENYDSTKAYPVAYVLDGGMNEDFLHICGLFQFFNLQFQMPEFIVVGIVNVDRKRDFTYHTDLADLQQEYPTTGHSDQFILFLEKELKPYIEFHFRTQDTAYIIGQSLGGLLATEILTKKPNLFTHYFIVSPSLWWDNQSLLTYPDAMPLQMTTPPKYIYISVGKKEHPVMRKDARKLYSHLRKLNLTGCKLHFNPMKMEKHATILHNSLYDGFLVLYPFKE